MKKLPFFVAFIILFSLGSCGDKYRLKLNTPDKITVNTPLNISVSEKNKLPIDSVAYFIDGIRFSNVEAIDISTQKLGKHAIKARVFYHTKQKELTNTIYFLASVTPTIYGYKIVNTYPHDASAFTQGLEYYNGFLYESTGQYGKSSIRKVDLKTGKVLQNKDLDKQYFGEGLTIFDSKLFNLSWKKKIGFIFNLNDFSLIKTFPYGQSLEGWGLTHNESELVKSDGTERIWFLDPKTQSETHFIEAYTNTRKVEELNELEYINGKIYANVWQKNTILIINPSNGTIEGIIDFEGLDKLVKKVDDGSVLNGIAYDKNAKRIFVTGKNWDKLFEIEIFIKK